MQATGVRSRGLLERNVKRWWNRKCQNENYTTPKYQDESNHESPKSGENG